MLKFQWESLTVSSYEDFTRLKNIVNTVNPEYGAVDTETDGLHIMLNKPFVVQFGFLDTTNMKGYTFAIDLEKTPILAKEALSYWNLEAKKLKVYMGHNVKFDLHMLANIGFPYEASNLTDTMFWIRYGHDALHPEEGGPPLGLKEYATKYIDRNAKLHESQLTKEKSSLVKEYNNRLKTMLNRSNAKLPEGAKSFTIKVINDLFKDCIFEVSDLPDDIKKIYIEWRQSLPLSIQPKVQALVEADMIPYNLLNREKLITYAHYDIIYTLEIFMSLYHIVHNRQQTKGIEIENECILPWYEMERTGFNADTVYLEKSRLALKSYIIERRKLFYELADQEIAVGQHAAIKDILNEKYNLNVKSTGNEPLNLLKTKLPNDSKALEFINLLQELRTLEKWYSAYILRFQKELRNTNKLYTSINQVGAVSGRVTSDFQQFPKKPIKDINGNELFHPRRIVKTETAIIYLDYSQIELRFQALYTILVGHPDKNMCQAYMPYLCIDTYGNEFNYNNPKHIANWHGDWFSTETNKHWEPTDVHGATTTAATGLTPEHPDFKTLRATIGKRTNFAKNYGAELGRIRQMFPEKTYEECVKINNAYYKAFPGVKEYHTYCENRAQLYSNTNNLFGVKYYNVSGHKLKNLLIQGSAAYFLKKKIIELYKYTKKHNLKTKMQMQIHDELSWEYDPEDAPEIFFLFKALMEDFPGTKVPIVADMEATTTTWAEKEDINTLEELKEKLHDKSKL